MSRARAAHADQDLHQVETIAVVRGDARTSPGRPLTSVDLPDGLNQRDADKVSLHQFANATFVPGSLVDFAVYYGHTTPALAGFLPTC